MSAGPSHTYEARPILSRAAKIGTQKPEQEKEEEEEDDENGSPDTKGKESEKDERNYLDPGWIEEIFDPRAPDVPAFSDGNPSVNRNTLRQLAIYYQRDHRPIKDQLIELDRRKSEHTNHPC